jgi:hypothetical protein
MVTADVVRHNKVKDLRGILDEGSKASRGTDGADDAAKLQSLQGHSPSDADEGSAKQP